VFDVLGTDAVANPTVAKQSTVPTLVHHQWSNERPHGLGEWPRLERSLEEKLEGDRRARPESGIVAKLK
jgi:hypothetical protein